jgi:hypothetical protein
MVSALTLLSLTLHSLANSESKRKEWWLRSKRLDPGAFVCIVQSTGAILFCTMDQNGKPRGDGFNKSHKKGELNDSEKQFRGLFDSPQRAAAFLVIEDPTTKNVRSLLTLCRQQSQGSSSSLVEFPGILIPAFKPTLSALQQMKATGDLPLSQFLVPTAIIDQEEVLVPPPAYTQKSGFRFNLKCIMKNNKDLFLTPGKPFDTKLLQEGSTLDEAQARALVDSLCRSLALMQGPPGTGKSFVGVALIRVLLAIREASRVSKGMSNSRIGAPLFSFSILIFMIMVFGIPERKFAYSARNLSGSLWT